MLLLLDNYDSFTYNLYDYFLRCGAQVEVVRNDELDLDVVASKYSGIILSPGPGRPEDAGCTMELIQKYHTSKPIFGVCLGMQALALHFGGELKRATYPMHGKVSTLSYRSDNQLFEHITDPFEVCRYHSLIVDSLEGTELEVLAETEEGEVMAVSHKTLLVSGVQFHPEAILTKQGLQVIKNWVSYFTLQGNNS